MTILNKKKKNESIFFLEEKSTKIDLKKRHIISCYFNDITFFTIKGFLYKIKKRNSYNCSITIMTKVSKERLIYHLPFELPKINF